MPQTTRDLMSRATIRRQVMFRSWAWTEDALLRVVAKRANLAWLLLTILVLLGCGKGADRDILSPDERRWLGENQGRIVLAVETNSAPLVFHDARGLPTGLAHDYLLLLEAKLGVRFRQRSFATLDEIFSKVRSGEIHVVNAIMETPWRSEFLTFTRPFITVPNVIIVREDRTGSLREEDLRGLKVSLVRSFASTERLTDPSRGVLPDLVSDDLTGLLHVSMGRSDAGVFDLATVSHLIQSKGITNLRVAGESSAAMQLAMGTPKGEAQLHHILEKGLGAITAAEHQEIRRRWIHVENSGFFADRRLWLVVSAVLSAIGVIVGTVLVWNRILRRQIAMRTLELSEGMKALAASEEKFRSYVDQATDVIFTLDAQGTFLFVSPAWERHFGHPVHAVMGGSFAPHVHPDDLQNCFEVLAQVMSAGQSAMTPPFRVRHSDGSWRWFIASGSRMPLREGEFQFLGVGHDLTPRIHAETQLRQASEDLKESQRIAKVGSWRLDIATNQVVWSEELYRMYGFDPGLPPPPYTEHQKLFTPESWHRLSTALANTIETGIPYEVELETVHEGKSNGWMWAYGKIVLDANGNKVGLAGAAQDITERKQAEIMLRESEARVRTKLDAILTPEGGLDVLELEDILDIPAIREMMGRIYSLTGITSALLDLKGKILIEQGFQEICTRYHRAHPEACRNCQESDTELASQVSPGTFKLYKCKNSLWDLAAPIHVGGRHVGNIFLGQFFFEDEVPNRGVFQAQAKRFGFNEAEYLAALDQVPRVSRADLTALGEFYARFSAMISNLSHSSIRFARMHYERNQAEQALRLTRFSVENASDSIFWIRPDGSIADVNEAACRSLGYTRAELLRLSVPDIDTHYDAEQWQGHFAELRLCGSLVLESEQIRKDGQFFSVEVVANYVKFGEEERNCAFVRDITARKRSEAALLEAKALTDAVVENVPLMIFLKEATDLKFVLFNRAGEELLGYDRNDLLGKNNLDLFPPEQAAHFMSMDRKVLDGGAGVLDIPEEAVATAKKGHRVLHTRKVCLQGADGTTKYLLGISEDITERKQAEEQNAKLQAQLQQFQKMESLGTLAGGVAHDMNNVLGAILGLASAHLGAQPSGTPIHQALDTICMAAERGGKMVKSLLSFARQTPAENHEVDLNAILKEQINLLERTTLAKVRLRMNLEPELRPIMGDASALTHAVMNLCVNAVDAIAENGILTLHTCNVDNDWIEVVVEDNGTGMPKEVLDKALDPFFTTKGIGKGTGLGLSMVYSTVKAHRGQMTIQSEQGRGTRVMLRFPACEQQPQSALPADAASTPIPKGSIRVLVVDDDELIQSSTVAVLEVMGHTAVTTAQSGEEALTLLEDGLEPDLVILDMNMPGIGGAGTLPRLRELRPEVPVLLATGRTDQTALTLASAHPGITLLSKPFGMRELEKHLTGIGLV